jgi:Mrp family chromosome partitioning ATPase
MIKSLANGLLVVPRPVIGVGEHVMPEPKPPPVAPAPPIVALARIFGSEVVPLPMDLDPRLLLLSEPESAAARGFRLLCHRLEHAGDPRVVLVTSACKQEGTTTLAVNLALALAENGGARVLLIEANARRPALASMFEIDKPLGLVRQMLRLETALLPWTTHEIAATRLHVLVENPDRAEPAPRHTFEAALGDLRPAFDRVVIDAPSVLDGGDIHYLLAPADAVVFAARAGKSRARDITRAMDQLAPANVLGVVLLGTSEKEAA